MEKNLDILNKIARVKAPDDILANVISKVDELKFISINWVKASIAIFVVLICFELYLCRDFFVNKEVRSSIESSSLADAYQVTNNFIYE